MDSDPYIKSEYDGVFEKSAEDRTEFSESVSGRKTSLEEELTALSRLHENFPDYFPEPVYAMERDGEVSVVWMEEFDLDTRLEYATAQGYTPEDAMELYSEVYEVMRQIHEDPSLMPHGDLIGNVWITEDQNPVLFDPRGVPENREEELRWMRDDLRQLDWIADSLEAHSDSDYISSQRKI